MVAAIDVSLPKSSFLQNSHQTTRNPHSCFLGGASFQGFPLQLNIQNRKRYHINLVVASNISSGGCRFYLNFTGFPFPLGPFFNRRSGGLQELRLLRIEFGFSNKNKR